MPASRCLGVTRFSATDRAHLSVRTQRPAVSPAGVVHFCIHHRHDDHSWLFTKPGEGPLVGGFGFSFVHLWRQHVRVDAPDRNRCSPRGRPQSRLTA